MPPLRRLLHITGIVCILMTSAAPAVWAGEGDATLAWVKQVVAKSLEYHCRIKYGDDPRTPAFTAKLLREKWRDIGTILAQVPAGGAGPWGEIDQKLMRLLEREGAYELYLLEKEKELQQQFMYAMLRFVAEDMGGEQMKRLYAAMPDNWEGKQDIQGLAKNWLQINLDLSKLHAALSAKTKETYDRIRQIGGADGKLILAELNRRHSPTAIALYERDWLKKNRPGLYDYFTVKGAADLRVQKDQLAFALKPETLADIRKYGGNLGRQWLFRHDWMRQYEEQELFREAAQQGRELNRLFWHTYQDAMRTKAASLDPRKDLLGVLQAWQQSTLHPLGSTGVAVIDPTNKAALDKQVQAAAGKLGFLGAVEIALPALDLELLDKGKRAVLLCETGLITMNLTTGQREQLMFDVKPGVRLVKMAVSPDDRYAYVVTSESEVLRYDLKSGRRDEGFKSPEVKKSPNTFLAVSPDGKQLAVAAGTAGSVYDIATGKSLSDFRGYGNMLPAGMCFSPDGKSLIQYGGGVRIVYVDLKRGKVARDRRFATRGNPYVRFYQESSTGLGVAAGDGGVAVWRGNDAKPLYQVKVPEKEAGRFLWADVTPDRQHVVSPLGVWKLPSGEAVQRYSPNLKISAMDLTPDGQKLVLTRGRMLYVVPLALMPPQS